MPRPELIVHRPRPQARLSIILLDWGVRESFHSLHYLNLQNVPREQYELIWLEFYQHRPRKLEEMVFRNGSAEPLVDQWLVAGYEENTIYNKHRLYNVGILLSKSPYCVICDSDAMFTPNFCGKLLEGFEATPRAVIHLDEIRNEDRRFHPFSYPSIEEVLGPGCYNWHGTISRGLDNSPDMLHQANYGACMAAPRQEILRIGAADEHIDYLGYVCGPYEMTFRLGNRGVPERWLRDEYLYHVWHPNESGINTDYNGPHDGASMSLRALEARAMGRVEPCLENPWIHEARHGKTASVGELLRLLAAKDEPTWRRGRQPTFVDGVFCLERDYKGFNLYLHGGRWYGLHMEEGYFDPAQARRYRALLEGWNILHLRQMVDYYTGLPRSWWQRMRTQPLYRLPYRAAKRLGKELSRLF